MAFGRSMVCVGIEAWGSVRRRGQDETDSADIESINTLKPELSTVSGVVSSKKRRPSERRESKRETIFPSKELSVWAPAIACGSFCSEQSNVYYQYPSFW